MTAIIAYALILLALIGATFMRFNKPCLGCKQLTTHGSYCESCAAKLARARQKQRDADPTYRQKKAQLYGGGYGKAAKRIKQQATECALCGRPFEFGDKIEADHLYPGDPTSPLQATHRECNLKKSNKQPNNKQ